MDSPKNRKAAVLSSPAPLPLCRVNLSQIPTELTELCQWVGWRWQRKSGHWSKVPVSLTGQWARANDSATWSSFAAAAGHFLDSDGNPRDGYAGIGFVFSSDDPFCGIDLDNPITASGQLAPWAQQIVAELGSYAEISPSGTGVKLWVRGKKPAGKHKAQLESF